MRTRVPLFALLLVLMATPLWAAESFPVKISRYAQSKWGAAGSKNGSYDAFRENALNNFCSGLGGCQGGKNNYEIFPKDGLSFKTPEELKARVDQAVRTCRQMETRVSQCCVEDAGGAASQSCQISGAATQAFARNVKRVAQKNSSETINQGANETQGMSNDAALTGAGVAGACYGRSEFCASKCEEVRSQLAQKLGSCANGACTEDMLAPLDEVAKSCRSMQGQADTISSNVGDLMKTSQEAGGIADQTNSGAGSQQGSGSGLGGMNPMSMLGPMMQALNGQKGQQQQQQNPQMMPQQAMANGLDQVDCNVNPNMQGCPAAGLQNVYKPRGDSGMSAPGSDAGSFNLGSGDLSSQSVDGTMDAGQGGTPPTINAIPNGGGSMPGGGGGGAASLGGGGGGGGGGAAGNKADILHGERSGGGGYGSMAEGMNMQSGDTGGGYSYGGGSGGGSGYEGMDLSQYLPGGRHDPGRRLAGFGGGGINSQILSRDVNIWNRISDRIRNRCNQGLLRDCSTP